MLLYFFSSLISNNKYIFTNSAQHGGAVAMCGIGPDRRWDGHEIVAEINKRVHELPIVDAISA